MTQVRKNCNNSWGKVHKQLAEARAEKVALEERIRKTLCRHLSEDEDEEEDEEEESRSSHESEQPAALTDPQMREPILLIYRYRPTSEEIAGQFDGDVGEA